jgi:hypothetical protein
MKNNFTASGLISSLHLIYNHSQLTVAFLYTTDTANIWIYDYNTFALVTKFLAPGVLDLGVTSDRILYSTNNSVVIADIFYSQIVYSINPTTIGFSKFVPLGVTANTN